jgi:DNA-binding PadR family transcriptional regulator
MFGHGDLKYVVLGLLEEKSRHGYEVIKELEERSGGAYSPSPGTVYPTLSLLEDLGYARSREEEGGKKVYEITDEGRKYLAENKDVVDQVLGRMEDFAEELFSAPRVALAKSMGELGRASFRAAARMGRSEEGLRRIREILDRAATEIDGLGRQS